ncbi:MAG: M1 family metallopeptidase [Actinomycetota bacterium]|nr:M1 family metallopeptidase [Actinomycetota bacterium]
MSVATMPTASELDPYRLPRAAAPRDYRLELEPDLDAGTFTGTVEIDVDVAEPLDVLLLNAIELDVLSCEIDGTAATWTLDEATERLAVHPESTRAAGSATLRIEFSGILNDKLRGFYRSTFQDGDGTERVIATTQMQATDCRRAFPCWDEPDFKATFEVTLVVDPQLFAISNGAETDRETRGDKVAVRFAKTMTMSTYLVAFIVGPLEATDPVDVGGIPLRVVHIPGKGHLCDFALDVGAFCLSWFQEYYGIPYPSDKVDLVALPDFAAGAMENLGCITFRETVLLVDPATSTQTEQQLVVDVVAHELAHMWFGDLVTMRWWNGIWLNEAFATFMEILACDAYRPNWHRWTTFGLERSAAFDTDSLDSTRPVEYEVLSPADCEGMFDVLTYQKGGALLRMLEQYLGPEPFRSGVSDYLRRHEYGNTETNDLWDAIEQTTGEPARRMMDSWIWQPGYPLVSASLDSGELVLRQNRFAFGDSEDAALWTIPVHVRVGTGDAGTEHKMLLEGDTVRLALDDPTRPVVVNAGGHGFFRVAYDDVLRGLLVGSTLGSLDRLERYNLVDDAWSSVVAGRLAASDFLTFVEGFGNDRDLAVWQAITIGLRSLGRLLADEDRPAFERRVAALVTPALADLGEPVEGEDELRAQLRGLLLATAAVLGADEAARQRARELFQRNEDEPDSVDSELLSASTAVVAATGNVDEYELFSAKFRTPRTPQEQMRYLYALAEFDDAELVARTCELAMSGEIKTQNAPFLLRQCIANRRHGWAAWQFVKTHWREANERFPTNTIVRMIDSVKLLNTSEAVADARSFFAEHPIDQATKTLEQVLERQQVNADLRQREADRFPASL